MSGGGESGISAGPIVRIEDASSRGDSRVRLVLSRVSDLQRLRAAWASSGAVLELIDGRLHASTTVDALARAAGRSLPADEAAALGRTLREAIAAWTGSAPALEYGPQRLETARRPLIIGIVNVTPDSFSDGGALYPMGHPAAAIAHGRRLLEAGADALDIGGESTRPGAIAVEQAEELRRVLPVVEALADLGVCSIDTRKSGVARAALAAGAQIVNDVSGGAEARLLEVAAAASAGYVLMHTRGTPDRMQQLAQYDDVVAEVYEYLADGLERCRAAGISARSILVDPGIGFAKAPEHNLMLLRALRQFRGLGRPVLVGASRRSFLGRPLGGGGPEDRLEGSLACATAAVMSGAAALRVHDVAETVRVVRVAQAITTGRLDWPTLEGVAGKTSAAEA